MSGPMRPWLRINLDGALLVYSAALVALAIVPLWV